MNDILPLATSSAVTVVTTTGLERIMVLVGSATILIFAIIGLIFVIVNVVKGFRNHR